MSDRTNKIYIVMIMLCFALILVLLAWLSPEGTAGLWRKIVINALISWVA